MTGAGKKSRRVGEGGPSALKARLDGAGEKYHTQAWRVRREWKDADGRLLRHRACEAACLSSRSALRAAKRSGCCSARPIGKGPKPSKIQRTVREPPLPGIGSGGLVALLQTVLPVLVRGFQ